MQQPVIAYFSMEITLDPEMPTYSGGLGVLSGDTVRSAADAKMPMVAVTLLPRRGYFHQVLDADGWQSEQPVTWDVGGWLTELAPRVTVTIENRPVRLRAWRFEVEGHSHSTVPVFLLDSDLPENAEVDRALTQSLYGGDQRYRLCQEVVLGIGGIRMLRALGYSQLARFHMNEGHAALLTLELLEERRRASGRSDIIQEDLEEVRRQCVFTTHTPVAAGHDRFPLEMAVSILGERPELQDSGVFSCEGQLNMTYLAMHLSHYVNGVAKRHRDVSREMFATRSIDAITNGVNAERWTCPAIQELLDRYIAGWREDNFSLRYAIMIPDDDVRAAHALARQALFRHVQHAAGVLLSPSAMTIGFARRATAYKRPTLLFHDLDRLRSLAADVGPLQIVFGGKAHPRDPEGKQLIHQIVETGKSLRGIIEVVYLPNYDIETALLLTSGVDLWLNTPQPPQEASGTSGMKAALNGVPSLSVLDGWWIEGCLEGVTGWSIGTDHGMAHLATTQEHANSLYDKLEECILPTFFRSPAKFAEIMRHAIAINGSFFNTQRMVQQYALKAWLM